MEKFAIIYLFSSYYKELKAKGEPFDLHIFFYC